MEKRSGEELMAKQRDQWEDEVLRPALDRQGERREHFKTTSGIPVERVYTPEVFFPLIDQTAARLGPDAAIRAKVRGEDDAAGARLLARDAQLLKDHLTKRRQFLLGQEELRAVAPQR